MMTVAEVANLLTCKSVAVGLEVKMERSPVSDTVYVELTSPWGWTARVRVSNHDLPGRDRYPLELRTTDPESAIDDVVGSLAG